jgi:hypothetical protein
MENVIRRCSQNSREVSLKAIKDRRIIEPRFTYVHGCIIIDNEGNLNEENVNIQRLLSIFGDKTGYEASANEVRINDYIEDDSFSEYELVKLGLLIIESWKRSLLKTVNFQKFQFVLSSNEGYVTIRTYTIRKEEQSWLYHDLEKYSEAIAVL